jgi:hypothetical protein
MVRRTRIWVGFVPLVLVLMHVTGCTGDDGSKDQEAAPRTPVTGSFVGKLKDTQAFVAVVAGPDADGTSPVTVHVSDGRGRSATLTGEISDNTFTATADKGGGRAEGTLTPEAVTGTVELPGGESGSYEATPPSGAAGLYELTVSKGGGLSGASASGLALSGDVALGKDGKGKVRLVDGRRLAFAVTRSRAEVPLRAGQVRLIVLENGQVRGIARGRPDGDRRAYYALRSS